MTTIYPKICSKLNLEKIQAYKKCLDKTPYQSLRRTTIKNIYIWIAEHITKSHQGVKIQPLHN